MILPKTYTHASNYNVIATDANGDTHLMFASQLNEYNLHYWKGWSCNAGVDHIYVTETGDIYGGLCENDYLGNLHEEYALLNSPTECKREKCSSCTDDLLIDKHKKSV